MRGRARGFTPCLGEPRGPLEKVQQCTVEQLAEVVPMVQILDTLGLLGVGSGGGGRRPQKAEQLVEVPTEPGYPLAVLAVRALKRRAATALPEQTVGNPVPQGRRGGGGGLLGSG